MRLLLAFVVLAHAASAQKTVEVAASRAAPGECAVGTAEGILDAGDVRAALYNVGGLFWRGSGAQYEVPKGTGVQALFSASLWTGGLVDDSLHFAGSTYGPWEF